MWVETNKRPCRCTPFLAHKPFNHSCISSAAGVAPDFSRRNSWYPDPRRASIANDRNAHTISNARKTLPERIRIGESLSAAVAVDEIADAAFHTCPAQPDLRPDFDID